MAQHRILKDYKEVEKLRRKVFDIKPELDYYENNLKEGKMIAVGSYIDDKLVGAAYISSSLHSLFIEQLFVHKEHQKKGIGSNLIRYILKHKNLFENYFNEKFIYSKAEPSSEEAFKMVQNLGYERSNDALDSVRKYL